MRVLDLFCGMGGFSTGFARAGFEVLGVDLNPWSEKIFSQNHTGKVIVADLQEKPVLPGADIVIGGPPCRPFSCLNVKKRREDHPDYKMISVFFEYILEIKPVVFFFENVLPVASDLQLRDWCRIIEKAGYTLQGVKITYSEFGSALSRNRFLMAGSRDRAFIKYFPETLERAKERGPILKNVIWKYRDLPEGSFPDHEWPHFRTIEKYKDKYRNGKFGWIRLDWNGHAPSFGNVMKTYVLHPDGHRVISVREALSIWGFDEEFRFPAGMGKGMKYQMIADAVSPVFSAKIAQITGEMLCMKKKIQISRL